MKAAVSVQGTFKEGQVLHAALLTEGDTKEDIRLNAQYFAITAKGEWETYYSITMRANTVNIHFEDGLREAEFIDAEGKWHLITG